MEANQTPPNASSVLPYPSELSKAMVRAYNYISSNASKAISPDFPFTTIRELVQYFDTEGALQDPALVLEKSALDCFDGKTTIFPKTTTKIGFVDAFDKLHAVLLKKCLDAVNEGNFLDDRALALEIGEAGKLKVGALFTDEYVSEISNYLYKAAISEKLSRPLINLYQHKIRGGGFYSGSSGLIMCYSPKSKEYKDKKGTIVFSCEASADEGDTAFIFYGWSSKLIDANGNCLAYAGGNIYKNKGYNVSCSNLIDAADHRCDDDVNIAHGFIQYLEDPSITEGFPADMYIAEIFDNASLVTVTEWERNINAGRGYGMHLLEKTLRILKRKAKTDIAIVANVKTIKYLNLDNELLPHGIAVNKEIFESKMVDRVEVNLESISNSTGFIYEWHAIQSKNKFRGQNLFPLLGSYIVKGHG